MEEKHITTRPEDILLIRVGLSAKYNTLFMSEQEAFPSRQPGGLFRFEATQESLRWLRENKFATIACDNPSFERGPIMGPYNDTDANIH